MNELVLKVENINKKFGKKEILKNVNLEIYKGDILGFIGPNGAGKTTTIKLILGLQSIDSGRVLINGYDIKENFVKAISKVGAIVENPDMYMYLSGYKNLELVANMYKNISKDRIMEVVKLVGLEHRIYDKVSKYSLGMRQRLGIAAAILPRPNILVLDEPTNGLDPEGIRNIRELLKNLAKKEEMAILISSHILSELESFCTKVAIIKNGSIIEVTNIKKIKHELDKDLFVIEIDNTKKLSKDERFEVIDEHLCKIMIQKENIPNLINELINKNIKIYEIKEVELTLEEAFMKKTGGNIID